MERISAKMPAAVWLLIASLLFGMLALFILSARLIHREIDMKGVGVIITLGLALGLVYAFNSWFFVDEVWDLGETLSIRKRGKVVIVPLRDIAGIEQSILVKAAYVTLVLSKPCELGSRINFHPRDSWGIAIPFENCASIIRLKEKLPPNQSPDPMP